MYPFMAATSDLEANMDELVDSMFACLDSEFMVMPKGEGFVDYVTFENAYEQLKRDTCGFADVSTATVLASVRSNPLGLVVLRTMLGFTPPEWAEIATSLTQVEIPQSFVRNLDRSIRLGQGGTNLSRGVPATRVQALVETACRLLHDAPQRVKPDELHRLDKVDTMNGLSSVRTAAQMGISYAMVLYERLLGRPFASHRDSISEQVGDSLESAIEGVLAGAGVSYRKTKRAEKISGFDQAPDFIIPSEHNPLIVVECKVTQDDGTARDKVTRVQHLAEVSRQRIASGMQGFETIACISGRGFRVRREDMKKLIRATHGKVFTPATLEYLVEHTGLKRLASRGPFSSD